MVDVLTERQNRTEHNYLKCVLLKLKVQQLNEYVKISTWEEELKFENKISHMCFCPYNRHVKTYRDKYYMMNAILMVFNGYAPR